MAAPATNTSPDGGHTSPKNSNNSDRTTDEDREFNKNAIFDPAAEPPPAKRPRGRPPGSKNKPKPPSFVAVEANNLLRSHTIDVAPGADVISCLSTYARTHRCGVTILSATGSVTGISFSHAGPFKGQFDIFSLTGTISPDNTTNPRLSPLNLAILSGPGGNLLGGFVTGPLIAAGPVKISAAISSATVADKLPPAVSLGVTGTEDSDPVLGPTKVLPDGPGTGSEYNPGFNNMNMVIPNWRQQDGLQYGWPPHQQQQENGRRYYQ